MTVFGQTQRHTRLFKVQGAIDRETAEFAPDHPVSPNPVRSDEEDVTVIVMAGEFTLERAA